MSSSLASRLGDIPGVASVVVDLEGFGRGIDVRLEPGADEAVVMEKLRALLAAYGVRHERVRRSQTARKRNPVSELGVEVAITPIETGARIEVSTATVRSFRIVAANPVAVTQGLVDAWCQVTGRIPVEVVEVSVDESGILTVIIFDGRRHSEGRGEVSSGWLDALLTAVAGGLGYPGRSGVDQEAS